MGADNRRINADVARDGTRLPLEVLPEPVPDATTLPAAKAVGDRGPVPKLRGEIAPRGSGPGAIQDRRDKEPITERRRATGAGFQGGEDRGNFRPRLVGEQQTYRHPISSISRQAGGNVSSNCEFVNTP